MKNLLFTIQFEEDTQLGN